MVYGVSVLCALIVVTAAASHPFNVYEFVEALAFGAITSAIPWGFIYGRRILAGYVASFIINFLLVTQAVAPAVTGIAVLTFIAIGLLYMLAPVRDAIRLFIYKGKNREHPDNLGRN